MLRARISAGAPVVVLVLALVLVLGRAASAGGATLFDPALTFRVLPTAHFLIYFHQGEEALAGRLAAIAEETWRGLLAAQTVTPPTLTHVVLVDQTDSANGWATPVPRNTVMVTAVWPPGSDFIGHTDDWLRVVFTHEFTHIVHLDRSEGWARAVRNIFGRVPAAFPNLFLPAWQIEGLATYQESTLTQGGRLHAGDFGAVTNKAARSGKLEPLDRVNGGLTDWPDGFAQYAYGLGFHRFLVERFGAGALAELSNRTAGRVPYTASRVFKDVYGQPLGALWKQYLESLVAAASSGEALEIRATVNDVATRLTHSGFVALGPRFDPRPCQGCPPKIFYSARTPHAFPTLNQIEPGREPPRPVATRSLGSTAAIGGGTIYFDQREMRRNAGVYSDLHALDRTSGRVVRLTTEARLLDPDLSPDGSTLACVRVAPGRRDLVTIATAGLGPRAAGTARPHGGAALRVLISEPDTQFDAPRWSPDSRSIAVERHRLGAWPEIVLVNAETGATTVVASAEHTRFVTPAWRPDGQALVTAVARDDEPFNLYELALDGNRAPRRLTSTTGGATWPDVSPDGTTIVYVGYTEDGFDLFTMPYPPSPYPPTSPAARTEPTSPEKLEAPREPRAPHPPSLSYSPFPTLKPTWWSPIVDSDVNGWRVGAETGGFDVLGYHAYTVSASWLTSHPAGAPSFNAASPDWTTSYAYTRWRPIWWASVSSTTSFSGGPPSDSGQATTAAIRERELAAGVVVPIRHVRVTHTAVGSLVHGRNSLRLVGGEESSRRTALRGGWSTSSARTYGFSVGPEDGFRAGVTAELARRARGSDAQGTTLTLDARGYIPIAAPHHVLALRLAGGASTGDRTARRTFLLGGPSPNSDVLSFSRGAMSLLRGFASNTFAGNRVALLNADYRFPLAWPQRGAGTWPAFIHTVHGAAFADVGHAWTTRFAASDIKTSLGGELSADMVAGYAFRFTATAGAAWGHDGHGTIPNRVAAYLRIGHAF